MKYLEGYSLFETKKDVDIINNVQAYLSFCYRKFKDNGNDYIFSSDLKLKKIAAMYGVSVSLRTVIDKEIFDTHGSGPAAMKKFKKIPKKEPTHGDATALYIKWKKKNIKYYKNLQKTAIPKPSPESVKRYNDKSTVDRRQKRIDDPVWHEKEKKAARDRERKNNEDPEYKDRKNKEMLARLKDLKANHPEKWEKHTRGQRISQYKSRFLKDKEKHIEYLKVYLKVLHDHFPNEYKKIKTHLKIR